MEEFFSGVELGVDTFKTINGNEFTIVGVDDSRINIFVPGNASANKLSLSMDEIRKMLESGQKFEKIKDITAFLGKTFATQGYSYEFPIYKSIKSKKATVSKANEANVAPRDDISVTKHGLKIPVDATNYAEFALKMKISEQEFLNAFKFN